MPRQRIPYDWNETSLTKGDAGGSHQLGRHPRSPILQLENPTGNKFFIHVISDSVVRVVHQLPSRFPQKYRDGKIIWEKADESGLAASLVHSEGTKHSIIEANSFQIKVDYRDALRLEWFRVGTAGDRENQNRIIPLLVDLHTRAYAYDESTGAVWHYTERESPLPSSELEGSPGRNKHDFRNEFIYGLGESVGSIVKNDRKFTMEARDAMGYDMDFGDPMYKIYPFYTVYNKKTGLWYGMYYNNLQDSTFDMGAENDAFYGSFRSFKSSCGPLDYYLLLGDGTLPSVIQTYASLLSPSPSPSPSPNLSHSRSSLTLPPRSQFGYLASSLGLSQSSNAQSEIVNFVEECRREGFPIDGLHLSSGWCQDPKTGARNYFVWNRERYPDPHALGRKVEGEMGVVILPNVKPWLLNVHPHHPTVELTRAFVLAAPDAPRADPRRSSPNGSAKSLLWSSGIGEHGLGSYLDFTSEGALKWWKERIREDLVGMGISGVWIDNNEFSGLMDDQERFVGGSSPWDYGNEGGDDSALSESTKTLSERLYWNGGIVSMGSVGRCVQTVGMAKATYQALLEIFPDRRPVIVTRSAAPGIQAYVHGTWSGDNLTTWYTMRRSVALTLSIGLSFGPGLYGHDIGGFEGPHNPSPELLVRWAQLGAWHTRFVVHSNKPVSTTLWMYKNAGEVGRRATEILREVVGWRYRLIPMMYSMFVSHWMRKGWPVLKPTFWYHQQEWQTLALDEQFIFGTHVLVAPVLEKGATNVDVYLPGKVTDPEAALSDDVEQDKASIGGWCELETGIWHSVNGEGRWIASDAPLERTPVFVREGGIIVLGGPCKNSVAEGETSRVALLFPSPTSHSTGSFTLIEDDGVSNDHTKKGSYLELRISFEAQQDTSEVILNVEYVHRGYKPKYDIIWFALPRGDQRKVVPTRKYTGELLRTPSGGITVGVPHSYGECDLAGWRLDV